MLTSSLGRGTGWRCALAVGLAFAAGCGSGDSEGRTPGGTGTGGAGTGGMGGADPGTGGAGQGGGEAGGGPGGGGSGGQGPVQTPVCGSADTPPPTPPSCAAGTTGATEDCGPDLTGCCENRLIPCGSYMPSYDGDTFSVLTPTVTLSDYRLDRYEITLGRYRAFVESGHGTQAQPPPDAAGMHPRIPGSGWDPAWNQYLPSTTAVLIDRLKCHDVHGVWTDAPGASEGRPMNCISWYDAFAFCAWDGGRLPTEIEWNNAASGGDEQRAYPWGTGIDDTLALYGCFQGTCDADFLSPVGSRSPTGDGRWGQSDLAGSMAEWTLDWFVASYPEGCVDCASVASGTERVLRGGGFVNNADLLLASYRGRVAPIVGDVAGRYRYVGARCARNP
ncbi:formylglycine-generating enzyme family protein [Chondromyces apiculatus]|nr:formylglycine-generating enzyme family protein [Chondromyces apiculatus]